MADSSFQAGADAGPQSSGTQSQTTEAQQQLLSFWQRQINDIRNINNDSFKTQELPLARIKKIMKLDEDVKMISAEAPVLFSKACEIFISELSLRAWIHTEDNKRRTLQRNDIAMAISKFDQFDFLIDIVPRDELKPAKRQEEGVRQTAMMPDQVQYYFQIAQQQMQQQPPQQQTGGNQVITLGSTGGQPVQLIQGQQAVSTSAAGSVIQPQQQQSQQAPTQQAQTIVTEAQQNTQQIITNTAREVQQVQFGSGQVQFIQQTDSEQSQTATESGGNQQAATSEYVTQINPGQAVQYQLHVSNQDESADAMQQQLFLQPPSSTEPPPADQEQSQS